MLRSSVVIVRPANNGPQKKPRVPMRQYNVGGGRKWLKVYAISNQEITTVANVMINDIIGHFRERIELHSDQRCNFQSEFFRNLCKR